MADNDIVGNNENSSNCYNNDDDKIFIPIQRKKH